jgi:hypothetical protein
LSWPKGEDAPASERILTPHFPSKLHYFVVFALNSTGASLFLHQKMRDLAIETV